MFSKNKSKEIKDKIKSGEFVKIIQKNNSIDLNDTINILNKSTFKVVVIEVNNKWSELRNEIQFNPSIKFF